MSLGNKNIDTSIYLIQIVLSEWGMEEDEEVEMKRWRRLRHEEDTHLHIEADNQK